MCVSCICFLLRSDHKASLFHKRLLICFAFSFFHQNRLFVLLDGGPFDVTRNELIAERGTPVGTSSGFLGAGDYGDKLWTAKRIIQFKIALRNVLVGQTSQKMRQPILPLLLRKRRRALVETSKKERNFNG